MSAFVALCREDRVELVTDGAVYEQDGTITDLPVKVETIQSPPCAMTMRGSSFLCEKIGTAVRSMIEGIGHFDVSMEMLQDSMHYFDWIDTLKAQLDDPGAGDVEMAIAGVSESKGPIVAYWSSRPNQKAGVEPFRLYLYRTGIVQGFPMTDNQADAMRKSGGMSVLGVRALEVLRREGEGRPGTYPFIVGGHVDLTTVTGTDVATDRLHTWEEDKIGGRIDPFTADKNVVPIRPMNRKQRRAAAKTAAA
jgi:hypothetical protein